MQNILLTFVFFIFCPVILRSEPQISMREEYWDFGRVPANIILIHNFWIRNTGTDTLKIIDNIPGLRCATEPISKSELAPGDSASLRLIANTRNCGGSFSYHTTISCNDPSRASLAIYLKANILHDYNPALPVRFEPERIAFQGDKSRYAVKAENLDSSAVRLVQLDWLGDKLRADIKERVIKPGKSTAFVFRWMSDTQDYDENIIATFETENSTRFSIPFIILGEKGQNPITVPSDTVIFPEKQRPVSNLDRLLKNIPNCWPKFHKRADSLKIEK
jgi:hypothetical protein